MTHNPNFNRIARIYRWAEYLSLGTLLQKTRTHFLPQLTNCRQALVLGDGDGRFLARLLHPGANQPPQSTEQLPHLGSHGPTANWALAPGEGLPSPDEKIIALAVDTSSTMLHLLRNRCLFASSRLQTLQASALDIEIPPATDLIVTHFFLDCLTQPELEILVHRIAAATQPGALWLLSDFQIPARPIFRTLVSFYIRALYLAFRILTGLRVTSLPNPQSALARAGFSRIAHHEKLFGVLYTEIWRRQ